MNRKPISVGVFHSGLIAVLLCVLSCECQAAAPTNQRQLAAANNSFAFNLLKQLVAEQPGSNIFISPYSASTVLQMVSTGAEGSTRRQMQRVLGTSGMNPAALNEANKEVGSIINNGNTNFILNTANAVWYRTGTPIKSAFIAVNQQFFGAEVEALDFNNPTSVDTINAWASEATHGKIDQIVAWPMDPKTRLFVANAVYFLGNWQSPFDTNLTTDRVFYLSGGGQETTSMMEQSGTFNYRAGNGYQAVQLPYQGGDLSMYVFLPAAGSSLKNLLGLMNGTWSQQVIDAGLIGQKGTVVLPKFKLDYAAYLNRPLDALGMKAAFTIDANFSKISSEPLYVSVVKQQAVVDVNETGTEAAAVTTSTITASVIPAYTPPPFQMIVDRPFLFLIEDQQTGTILFMGVVFEP